MSTLFANIWVPHMVYNLGSPYGFPIWVPHMVYMGPHIYFIFI